MSRNAQYRIKVEKPDGTPLTDYGERIWVYLTPAEGIGLISPYTIHDLPWEAFVGVNLPVTRGWKNQVIGPEDEGRASITIDLSLLKGSAEIEASREYWVNPRQELEGVISIGTYRRTYDLYNFAEIYSDNGTGNEPTVLKWAGVQVPPKDKSIEPDGEGAVEYELEFVDAITWFLKNTLPSDISAWALANAGVLEDGPYTSCRGAIWRTGGRTYTHKYGTFGHTLANQYYDFTFYPLDFVYTAVANAANRVARDIVRKFADMVQFVGGNPTAHWGMFTPDWTPAYAHQSGDAVPSANRAVCGKIVLHSAPSTLVHGFFYTGRTDERDTIGSWANAFEFLKDTTVGAVSKLPQRHGTVDIPGWQSDAPVFYLDCRAIKANNGTALGFTPEDFKAVPKLTIGRDMIRGVSITVPAGKQDDQPAMTIGETTNGDDDRTFALPRSWHTLPMLWPEGQRFYEIPSSPAMTWCDLLTFRPNCLTLFFKTTAGGILSSAEYVRIHQHVTVSDGVTTYTGAAGAYTFPAPDPIDEYNFDPEEGDTDFGSPLRQAYLKIQREASTPHVAAAALRGVFGSPMLTDYEGAADMDVLTIEQIGNRIDAAGFANGNVFLDGGTYLGSLPGAPLVAGGTFDLLTGDAEVRLEGL